MQLPDMDQSFCIPFLRHMAVVLVETPEDMEDVRLPIPLTQGIFRSVQFSYDQDAQVGAKDAVGQLKTTAPTTALYKSMLTIDPNW